MYYKAMIFSADEWYEAVMFSSDQKLYGEKAFEGWAMGGENMRWWKLICIFD